MRTGTKVRVGGALHFCGKTHGYGGAGFLLLASSWTLFLPFTLCWVAIRWVARRLGGEEACQSLNPERMLAIGDQDEATSDLDSIIARRLGAMQQHLQEEAATDREETAALGSKLDALGARVERLGEQMEQILAALGDIGLGQKAS